VPLHSHSTERGEDDELRFRPQFSQHGEIAEVPRLRLARAGMPPQIAFQTRLRRLTSSIATPHRCDLGELWIKSGFRCVL